MRLLGIDYGAKRVGVAISDEDRRLAFPKSVILNSRELSNTLRDMALEAGTTHIIMGESRNFKGEKNAVMDGILKLKNELEGFNLTVSLEPEFVTSQQAARLQGGGSELDASSAALILQSYLDKQHN